jgi:hypothetical protein
MHVCVAEGAYRDAIATVARMQRFRIKPHAPSLGKNKKQSINIKKYGAIATVARMQHAPLSHQAPRLVLRDTLDIPKRHLRDTLETPCP